MLDVFLVGALISMTKLRDLVRVEMAPGLWMLMALVWSLALFDTFFDRHRVLGLHPGAGRHNAE